jgi:peptide/nickel transport system substrate-binding protein
MGGSAETVRLAASTPLSSYADPLALDSGNGLIPSVFDGLTTIESNGTVHPALALSWTNHSGTKWVFELRPDVVFHDGSPFNADTVVDYLTFLSKPESFFYPIAAEATSIESARKLGPLTVEITTHNPDPVLPRKLSRIKIIPMQVWREQGRTAFSRQPVGTGPYSILEWGRGGATGVVMTAAQNSWRPPEQIDRVEYVILSDASARLQSLLSGAVDIANGIDPDAIPVVEAAGYTVDRQLGPIVLAIAFHNCGDTPTPSHDIRVRRALAMSVDKKRIVEQLLSNTTDVADQGGAPGVFGYNPDIQPYPFDPDAARSLLADAGYDNGLDLVIGLFSGQFPADSVIFQQMAQDWAAIGVNAELRRFAFPEYIRRADAADWDGIDAISVPWSSYQHGEVSRTMKRFAGDHAGPYFCAPELLDDIAASDIEMDENVREKMLQDLMARLHDLVPSLPLVRYVSINGLSPRVPELKSRNTGAILFGEMRVVSE